LSNDLQVQLKRICDLFDTKGRRARYEVLLILHGGLEKYTRVLGSGAFISAETVAGLIAEICAVEDRIYQQEEAMQNATA
jgi:hypothetical protein